MLTGEYGSYVHLDIRHLGRKHIDEKLPMVRELCVKYIGIDPVTYPGYFTAGVSGLVDGVPGHCLDGLHRRGSGLIREMVRGTEPTTNARQKKSL